MEQQKSAVCVCVSCPNQNSQWRRAARELAAVEGDLFTRPAGGSSGGEPSGADGSGGGVDGGGGIGGSGPSGEHEHEHEGGGGSGSGPSGEHEHEAWGGGGGNSGWRTRQRSKGGKRRAEHQRDHDARRRQRGS